MPKQLKIICLEVNLDNTNIMFKEWGRFYAIEAKMKMLDVNSYDMTS